MSSTLTTMERKILHCEHCGDSWYDSGISNASCPNCRIADLQRERDELQREKDEALQITESFSSLRELANEGVRATMHEYQLEKEIADLRAERDALQAWKTKHRWHCACVFDGDDEEPTQECNYHAGLRENSSHVLSDLEAANTELDALRQHLPPEMQDCTIRFVECPKGHGQLTATNWVQHECVICERNSLRKKYDDALLRLANQDDECLALIAERDALREGAERGYRAGLERAREICLGKKETMSFRTNNVPVEVTGFNNGVHDCADAIQREIEK